MKLPVAFDPTTDQGIVEILGWTIVALGAAIAVIATGWRKTRRPT